MRSVDERLLDRRGSCRTCGSTAYTVRELNVIAGQDFRCYRCLNEARWPGYGTFEIRR